MKLNKQNENATEIINLLQISKSLDTNVFWWNETIQTPTISLIQNIIVKTMFKLPK